MWRRDEELRVQSAVDAERFIEEVAFANMLTDARRAGPSFGIGNRGESEIGVRPPILRFSSARCNELLAASEFSRKDLPVF